MNNDTYKKKFADRLKYYMSINNKTQIDIINDLGINKSAISSWCNGTRLPRMDKIDMLAKYFDISYSDLLGTDNENISLEDTENEQRKIFSENLLRYLSKTNKSQKEVADAIEVSPQTFNTWCQAIAIPRMDKIQKLADYFNISKSDLIDRHVSSVRNNTQEEAFNTVFSKNLRYYLDKNNISQSEFAEHLNVGTTSVYNWCNGIKIPRMDKIDAMCDLFGCKRKDLMEEIEQPKQTNSINVYGRIAAGFPLNAAVGIVDTIDISDEFAQACNYFGLIISDDSMMPYICNGDVVIVRRQDDAETDEIVIAIVNGDDGVCKRLKKYADSIALVSNNPSYAPIYFNKDEIDTKPVRIIGKVVELRRKF